jgi:Protein of unknown function (DUF1344)
MADVSKREEKSMRRFLIPTIVTMLFAAISVANAAEMVGTIKTIDTAKDMITLQNGASYWAPSKVDLKKLKVGEKVNITYAKIHGKLEISAVNPVA